MSSPKFPNMVLAFDFKAFEEMSEDLLLKAKAISKEAGLKMLDYQQRIAQLSMDAATGKIEPKTAMLAVHEYNRTMRLVLSSAAQKMGWELVAKYRKASETLIQMLMLAPLEFIKKL